MDIKITGLDNVLKRLENTPSLLVKKVFYQALDRAAGVIAAEVELRTPEGEEGLLKENVITNVSIDTQGKGGSAAVGFSKAISERSGKPADLIAMWVEYGHAVVPPRGSRRRGHTPVRGHVPAHPFMRPAADAAAALAIEVFARQLSEQIAVIEQG